MNRSQIIIVIIAAVLSVMQACTGQEKSQYGSIDPTGWRYGDTLMLQPVLYESTDSLLHGDLSIVVRHTNNYEYSNLWLRIDYNDADTVMTDTVNVALADEYGNWLGQGIGVSYQRTLPVKGGITIDLSRPIRVTHIMRVDTLTDIEQIGVVFKPNPAAQPPATAND